MYNGFIDFDVGVRIKWKARSLTEGVGVLGSFAGLGVYIYIGQSGKISDTMFFSILRMAQTDVFVPFSPSAAITRTSQRFLRMVWTSGYVWFSEIHTLGDTTNLAITEDYVDFYNSPNIRNERAGHNRHVINVINFIIYLKTKL